MATNTTRVKLRRPQRGAAGDPNDPVNVTIDWNAGADILDDGIGWPTYTSTTHTSGSLLYDGKCEYESDTSLNAIWDASANKWQKYPVDQNSKGGKGTTTSGSNSSDFTSASGEVGPFFPITFTGESDRRYWYEFITWIEQVAGSPPATSTFRVRFASGGTVTTGGTQVGSDWPVPVYPTINREIDFHKIYEFLPAINGNVTVGLFLVVNTASVTVHLRANSAELLNKAWVKDVGI